MENLAPPGTRNPSVFINTSNPVFSGSNMVRVNGFRLEGVLPAVVTPFDKNEEFDEEAFRNLIDWLIERRITGIVPCGTTVVQM